MEVATLASNPGRALPGRRGFMLQALVGGSLILTVLVLLHHHFESSSAAHLQCVESLASLKGNLIYEPLVAHAWGLCWVLLGKVILWPFTLRVPLLVPAWEVYLLVST